MQNTDSLAVVTRRIKSAMKMGRSVPAQGHDAPDGHPESSSGLALVNRPPGPRRLPYDPRKPYIPPQRKGAKAMTIAAGFRCQDGVVLAADTEVIGDERRNYLQFWPEDVKRIEDEFAFVDKEIRSLLFAFPNLAINQTRFRETLESFGREMKSHRAETFRLEERKAKRIMRQWD